MLLLTKLDISKVQDAAHPIALAVEKDSWEESVTPNNSGKTVSQSLEKKSFGWGNQRLGPDNGIASKQELSSAARINLFE